MPRRGKTQNKTTKPRVRKGGRKLQPAVAGLYTAAAAGAAAARVANTWTGMTRRGQGLRGAGNRPAIRRANTEGYIPPVSLIIGDKTKNLSFNEKVQKVMNPPQTMLYQSQQKLETVGGRQGISTFTITNVYFSDFFAYMAAGKSDNAANSVINVDTTAVSNSVNHLYSSIQHTFMNSGNLTAELDIYVYKAIQDIGAADQAISAGSAWSYAESINGLATITNDGYDRIGKKPTDVSAKFYVDRYWKLIGKTTVQMKPGESFKHYFRKHYNRPYYRFMLSQDTSGATRDHSISFVYVVRGQVVGSNLNTDVSTGDAQISCVRNTKIQFCYGQNTRPRDYVVGTDLVQIAAANQTFINTDTSGQVSGFVEDA